MKTLRIELPDDALDGMSEEQAQVVAREALLVRSVQRATEAGRR